jgi:CHAT domain-containing protein
VTDPSIAELRAARQELDDVIGEIQRIEGFERFLAAPDFEDVARVAGEQPLVYLAAAEPGGLALVVRGAEVTDLELPALTANEVRTRTEGYLRDYGRFRRDTDSGELRAGWHRNLDEVTRWLWDNAVAPVLDELGDPPETAVVPCGLLGLLPLHAAWTEDATAPTGRRYAVDRTAFAYSANARALAACRHRAETLSADRVLAVYDSARLAYTEPEAMVAANAFPAHDVLAGAAATLDAVEEALRGADVFHAGCHGRADFADPLRSYLLLPGDRKLELDRILRMRLRIRLAVLSACESSLPGTELPDEVVGLPSGLVEAGVAGVVATMWATGQHASALLMTRFYRDWRGGSPALALAGAQRWLRDVTVRELEEEWETALDEGAAWLPAQAGEELLMALLDRNLVADDRPWSGIDVWAASAFTGA